MKILVISPHMDDEVLGTAGTICKYVKEGHFVKVCFVCNRAYNHKYLEKLIKEEKTNALSAKKILGYQKHIFLDLNDETVSGSLMDATIRIENVIKEFKPSLVYLPHPGDNNQDHRAIFEASMIGLRSFSAPYVSEVYTYEIPSSTEQAAPFIGSVFIPNAYVDIRAFIEKKKKALKCYKREQREFPHPRSIKSIEAWAIKRGIEAYLEYAEAFGVVRIVKR